MGLRYAWYGVSTLLVESNPIEKYAQASQIGSFPREDSQKTI